MLKAESQADILARLPEGLKRVLVLHRVIRYVRAHHGFHMVPDGI